MQPAATDATGPRNTLQQLPEWARTAGLNTRARASDIAKAIGRNKSSLSRFLDRHEHLRGPDALIDVVAFDAAYFSSNQVLLAAPEAVSTETEEASPQTAEDAKATASARRRLEEARARQAEMDLAEREGKLVSIDQVVAQVASIGVVLRDRLIGADIAAAEKLLASARSQGDVRELMRIMAEANRQKVEDAVRELTRLLDEIAASAATED